MMSIRTRNGTLAGGVITSSSLDAEDNEVQSSRDLCGYYLERDYSLLGKFAKNDELDVFRKFSILGCLLSNENDYSIRSVWDNNVIFTRIQHWSRALEVFEYRYRKYRRL